MNLFKLQCRLKCVWALRGEVQAHLGDSVGSVPDHRNRTSCNLFADSGSSCLQVVKYATSGKQGVPVLSKFFTKREVYDQAWNTVTALGAWSRRLLPCRPFLGAGVQCWWGQWQTQQQRWGACSECGLSSQQFPCAALPPLSLGECCCILARGPWSQCCWGSSPGLPTSSCMNSSRVLTVALWCSGGAVQFGMISHSFTPRPYHLLAGELG